MDTLSAIYLFCLVFGGGFFLVTSISGHGHHHLHIHHGNVEGLGHGLTGFLGHHGFHLSGSASDMEAANPLNLRNLLAFIAIFGLVGTMSVFLMNISLVASLLLSIPAGLIAAVCSWFMLLFAVSRQASSQPKKSDIIHQVGQVTVAIPKKGIGEITVVIKGQLKGMLARSQTGEALRKGEDVAIVRYEDDDTVAVVPLSLTKE